MALKILIVQFVIKRQGPSEFLYIKYNRQAFFELLKVIFTRPKFYKCFQEKK